MYLYFPIYFMDTTETIISYSDYVFFFLSFLDWSSLWLDQQPSHGHSQYVKKAKTKHQARVWGKNARYHGAVCWTGEKKSIMFQFKAYLESKSKMCIFSLTNTNQNPVFLSLCLVFLNAQVNAPNSSLNFLQYSLW